LAVLLLGCVTGAAAQPTTMPARQVDIDGLPHRSVYALLEDALGFLWIGTADGLARFDGYEVQVYRHDPFDPEGMSNSTVMTLLEDRHGRLWVGTENGLLRLDRRRDTFARMDPPELQGRAGVEVTCALEDSRGQLWFGTLSGLLRFDPHDDTPSSFSHRSDDPTSLRFDHVLGLVEDASARLWVLSKGADTGSVQRHEGDGVFVVVVEELRNPALWTIAIDGRDQLWIDPCPPLGTASDSLPARLERECRLGVETWAIDPSAGASLWMGTSEGLFEVDLANGGASRVELGGTSHGSLANEVRSVHRGRSGIVWAGTHAGLYSVNPHRKRFHHWDLHALRDRSEAATAVSSVVETRSGDLLVGTYGRGLARFERSGRLVARYPADDAVAAGQSSDYVWALARDQGNGVWVAAGDLVHLDLERGVFTSHPLPEDRQPTFVACDAAGRVWLASFQGLDRLVPAVGTYETVDLRSGGRPVAVDSLCLGGDGAMWAGTAESLFRIDLDHDVVREFALVTGDGVSLSGTGTWALHADGRGSLWLGTSLGLIRFDVASGRFELTTLRHGLPGSSVYSILEDDAGGLWLGTNQGLSRFDPGAHAAHRFRNFSPEDGLGNVEFNRHAACRTGDGAMVFGGLDGLTWFRPEEIRPNPTVPPVRLTRIEVVGRQGARDVNPFELERLVLTPGDVSFAIEFAALEFTNPRRNRYAYRLEGFDPEWVDAGTRRYAQYARVPPGDYLFRVRGANNDGVWNEAGSSLAVVVQPAFWQTWWFRVAVGLVVVGGVVGAYSYRMAQVRKVQQLRLDVAGDLHDDLSSDIAGIAVVADMLRRRNGLGERDRVDLEMIRDTARGMVEGVRDIVWYMDPEHDTLEATVDRMRAAADRMLRGTAHTISVSTARHAPDLSMGARRDLFLVYKEAVQNVVRHARADTVSISLAVEGRRLRLEVADDGVGFDPVAVSEGHGLRSMRRRAEQIGAVLEVESRPGRGTTVRLELDIARFRDGTMRSGRVG
jgi:ligand-binding sensor domain-containing protein